MLTRLQRAVEVIRLFDTVQPTGITPIGDRLNAILNDYLDELDAAKKAMREEAARSFKTDGPRKTKLPKPVNILVLTDGVPSEPSLRSITCVYTLLTQRIRTTADDPYSVIKDVATRMDRANYLLSQVRLLIRLSASSCDLTADLLVSSGRHTVRSDWQRYNCDPIPTQTRR